MIGESVEGHTVTEAGLIAAAWKEGAGRVLKVFNGQSSSDNLDKNVFFCMDEFGGVATGSDASSAVFSKGTIIPTGHWESPTQYDEMGNVIQSGPRVWVPDDVPPMSAGAGRGLVNPSSVNPDSSAPTQPNLPPTPQISPDGTTALLPNGQVIRAGTGGTLDIDTDGNLVVTRPAQGWTNADGSPSDIRQITTYDAKGAQIGTTIAQNLPGESSPVENYTERTVQVHNPDGRTAEVSTHFQAGVGWVDETGQTVLTLKDAQAQLDSKNAGRLCQSTGPQSHGQNSPFGRCVLAHDAAKYHALHLAQRTGVARDAGLGTGPSQAVYAGRGACGLRILGAVVRCCRNPISTSTAPCEPW